MGLQIQTTRRFFGKIFDSSGDEGEGFQVQVHLRNSEGSHRVVSMPAALLHMLQRSLAGYARCENNMSYPSMDLVGHVMFSWWL